MILLCVSLLFVVLLMAGSFLAGRRVNTSNEFVLSGQSLGLLASTVMIVASWYGAESLLTLSDEVARVGLRCIWIDPIGISLCLWIAGLWMVPRLYAKNVSTAGDLFREAAGRPAELIATCIIVPSYFGWIAAQLIAMGGMLYAFTGLPTLAGVLASAVVCGGLCVYGGNASLVWANTIMLLVIATGVIGLFVVIALTLGGVLPASPSVSANTSLLANKHWSLLDSDSRSPWITCLGAIAVGSIGNLPAIELLQRIRSCDSQKTASRACIFAGLIYLALGALPIGFGLAFLHFGLIKSGDDQVVSILTMLFVPASLQWLLFLAIMSTILSTVTSAAVSPATMLSINLVEPWWSKFQKYPLKDPTRLWIQRLCVALMIVAGTLLAMSGETAFQLVRDSYGLLLAAIAVPFIGILGQATPSRIAVLASMVVGFLIWTLHWMMDATYFLEPLVRMPWDIPHELGGFIVSSLVYLSSTLFAGRTKSSADQVG